MGPGIEPFTLAALETVVLRAPVREAVRTAFGVMRDRPAVLVRARDGDGTPGWGEVWCNFPACGAEHRARLVETEIAPLLEGAAIADLAETFGRLTAALRPLVRQTGEDGPVAQAIAGVDMALWDIAAKRAGEPLWRFLGGATDRVPAYASGINPDRPELMAARRRDGGFAAFKLKLGFDDALDLRNVAAVRQALGANARLMADANQAWDLDRATGMVQRLAEFSLTWMEEPLAVDAPARDWRALAEAASMPLAGGENLRGRDAFEAAIASGWFGVLQPDLGKWGGFSECLPVARAARAAGVTYCPHWLGGGIGLLASAHLLAAVGGPGLLEVDANDNPLREGLAQPFPALTGDGCYRLGEAPGLGVAPDPACLRAYGVA